MVHTGTPPIHYVSGDQHRQVLQPEARGLGLAVAKHPRLYYLVGLADTGADDADRIFYRYPRHRRSHQPQNEVQSLVLLLTPALEPRSPGTCQMGARREGYQQVPTVLKVKQGPDVTLEMGSRGFSR